MYRLRGAVRGMDPGYFALVMATCIVSRAMQLNGAARLSGVLLATGIVAYVLLVAVYAWRLAAYPAEFRADAADPRRAFGFFSLAAGSDVLAARLAADAHAGAATVLLVIGGVSWVRRGDQRAGRSADPATAARAAARRGACRGRGLEPG